MQFIPIPNPITNPNPNSIPIPDHILGSPNLPRGYGGPLLWRADPSEN